MMIQSHNFGCFPILATCCFVLISAELIVFDVLSPQGHTCRETCVSYSAECDQSDLLKLSEDDIQKILQQQNVNCYYDTRSWWAFDQPAVVVDPFDQNFGRCLGWKGKPEYHDCGARHPATRRLCRCRKALSCPRTPRIDK